MYCRQAGGGIVIVIFCFSRLGPCTDLTQGEDESREAEETHIFDKKNTYWTSRASSSFQVTCVKRSVAGMLDGVSMVLGTCMLCVQRGPADSNKEACVRRSVSQ